MERRKVGLLDKNGIEIMEGDKLKVLIGGKSQIHKVIYDEMQLHYPFGTTIIDGPQERIGQTFPITSHIQSGNTNYCYFEVIKD